MFSKLREILLTQYIGSILVALLVWQAVIEVVTSVVRSGFWYFNYRRSESVLGGSSGSPFRWDNFIFSSMLVLLYLLAAYALVRWLYPAPSPSAPPEAESEPSSDQPKQS